MTEQTISARRQRREDEAAEPFKRAARFAAGVASYIQEQRLFAANAQAIWTAVEVTNGERKFLVTALPLGKWNADGHELDHPEMLDAALDFLGWPPKDALDHAA
jgi:hypothetical protein